MKEAVKQQRDNLQQGIYKVINPFVRLLIKIGLTPNMVTTIGFIGNLIAAGFFAMAGYRSLVDHHLHTGWIGWGGLVLIVFSLFDMLDGQVARLGNMSSTFGAMYDSVLDRYSELVTLGGLAYYLICINPLLSPVGIGAVGALITFVALVGSIMVSYVRARAEGLGLECKIGFMQRPERVVLTALATAATGIIGAINAPDSKTAILVLIVAMGIIAIFANITAFARINHCRRLLRQREGK